ncbi:MAG: hypothetical protein GC206_04770 [Alphaproteobacteria bacterium]|nr:hypothetical protein [Alphaproteobacteria bacterium]
MANPHLRNLGNLRPTASTTRVLDLALVAEKFGDTDEFRSRPFFRTEALNHSIILKHTLRHNERNIFKGMRLTATKVLFPFDPGDLRLGGQYVFIDEPDFQKRLTAKIGVVDSSNLAADLDVLAVVDALPSFDPFLMRERLRQIGREPARCYFDVSLADMAKMQSFVTSQIAQLVELAFKSEGAGAATLSERLALKLMTDETAQSLEPLRATLRLSGDEYREGVFAWKGFLYYKWSIQEWGERLPELSRSILSARVINIGREELAAVNSARQIVIKLMGSTMRRINAALSKYDEAFRALQEGRPAAFRSFLLKAPEMFLDLGEAVGVIKHLDTFWRFRFPPGRLPLMEGPEATEIFEDFRITVSGLSQQEAISTQPL